VEYQISLELKFDIVRHYYIELKASELEDRPLPHEFVNVVRRNKKIECQTLALIKTNQKVCSSGYPHCSKLMLHRSQMRMKRSSCSVSLGMLALVLMLNVNLGHEQVQALIEVIRTHMSPLFKSCESIGLLDMVSCDKCQTLLGLTDSS
jgi:DNA mismatch repair protein MSH4